MNRNTVVVSLAILLGLIWSLWPSISLHWAKKKALDKLTDGGKISLAAREIQSRDYGEASLENTLGFQNGKSLVVVSQPESVKEEKMGVHLFYPGLKVSLINISDMSVLGNMPETWGGDDFEKMLYLEQTSEQLIRDAQSPEELQNAVATLTTKLLIQPMATDGPTVEITGDGFTGLLSGSFEETPAMLSHVKSDAGDLWMVLIQKTGEADPEGVHAFFDEMQFRALSEN